ncbi:hypothetical protein ANCCEY_06170 [Ancylostoma ceylanicum]|uniref:RNase III domain-containing protein n=1 Tax=Ancylostoma ceylanicum TaxID=53326 RepID=A0A0D6LRN7_9BILA|nr:hypothetical protein ANCCEY_06170 [Ancylostoma ceylanicum]
MVQSQICEDLGLHYFIIEPPGGSSRTPELSLKDKADLVEALIGAIFVDRGWDYCRVFIYICFLPRLKHFIESKKWNDSKSQLQQNMRLAVGEACTVHLAQMDAAKKALEEYKEMFSSLSKNNVKNAASAFMKKLQEAQQRPSTYFPKKEDRPRPPPLIGIGAPTILPPFGLKRSSSSGAHLDENPAPQTSQRQLQEASPLVKQMLKSVAASYRQFSAATSLQGALLQQPMQSGTSVLTPHIPHLMSTLPTMSPYGALPLGLTTSFGSSVQATLGGITFTPSLFQMTPQFLSNPSVTAMNPNILHFGNVLQQNAGPSTPQPLIPKAPQTTPSSSSQQDSTSRQRSPSKRAQKRRRESLPQNSQGRSSHRREFDTKLQEAQQRPSTYFPKKEDRPRPPPLIGIGAPTILPPFGLKRSSSSGAHLDENPAPQSSQRQLQEASPLVKQMLKSVAASYRQFSAATSLQGALLQQPMQSGTSVLTPHIPHLMGTLPTMSPYGALPLGLTTSFGSSVQATLGGIAFTPSLFQMTPQFLSNPSVTAMNPNILHFGNVLQPNAGPSTPQPLIPKAPQATPSSSSQQDSMSRQRSPSKRAQKRRRESLPQNSQGRSSHRREFDTGSSQTSREGSKPPRPHRFKPRHSSRR